MCRFRTNERMKERTNDKRVNAPLKKYYSENLPTHPLINHSHIKGVYGTHRPPPSIERDSWVIV